MYLEEFGPMLFPCRLDNCSWLEFKLFGGSHRGMRFLTNNGDLVGDFAWPIGGSSRFESALTSL